MRRAYRLLFCEAAKLAILEEYYFRVRNDVPGKKVSAYFCVI